MISQNNISTHHNIIIAIHENWGNGMEVRKWGNNAPFALRDVASRANVSISSVTRALRLLKKLKFVTYSKTCTGGRHYRVSEKWPPTTDVPTVTNVIEQFELAKIVKL